ncbi:peptidoglycan DD-metalloendopeptidase family protein [Paenibacillus kobensis]|uniref:peptidoglycan DD-metalloendopeptidase family protein n=1 Tax=Paenibacillus kobensis TaxID=59841 RepID=UPI000FDB0AF1|nr:peptidoglycan DD-metalloendopeptidase family protein [Paenibacillus kobensis]
MKRSPKPKWSFVLMRGADKSVKQFKVSKRSVVAAPAAAVLALSGCIAALQIRSAFKIDSLHDEMSQQSNSFTHTVNNKDDSIGTLQEEIRRLNRQAEEMKGKINDLRELENKLKTFIEQYGRLTETSAASTPADTRTKADQTVSPLSSSASASASASASPTVQEAKSLIAMAEQSGLDFREISSLVDSMESAMEQSVKQAQARQAILDALPTGWPTKRPSKLTSSFGYRSDPFTHKSTFHAGVDIGGSTGDPVFSAADGTVEETGRDASEGNYIVINHHNGLKTKYMHLSRIEASAGDEVVRGEKIGLMGSTGRSTGAHLHFQIMQHDEPINPMRYLDS